jgi:uncharacterized protein
MKIAIAGGTGFVGKSLVRDLVQHSHEVIVLTRKPSNGTGKFRYVQWLSEGANPAAELEGTDIFINLAGESINSGRWTEQRKKRILDSRIVAVRELLDIITKMERKPQAFINASAIGYYGTSLDKTFTEGDQGSGDDFLSKTVIAWEREASKAEDLGVRTVLCRFGIILDKQEGALAKMLLPYRAFIGGPMGSGTQWMSWIHIDDVIKGIQFVMENEQVHGPVNFTAPSPVTMNEFGSTLAGVLGRPHWLPVPGSALRILLGEMSTLVVDGQKVLPDVLTKQGYLFKYPELKTALKNIFS